MELGMTQGKFSGKYHNCGKQGHKAVECWSGGKDTILQLKTNILADQSKAVETLKR